MKTVLLTGCALLLIISCEASAQSPVPGPTPALQGGKPGVQIACPAPTPMTCVMEPKETKKTVHGSVCKEYCVPKCSLHALWHRCCGDCGCCCELRTRRVLTKKIVPGCPVPTCVVKPLTCEPCLEAVAPVKPH